MHLVSSDLFSAQQGAALEAAILWGRATNVAGTPRAAAALDIDPSIIRFAAMRIRLFLGSGT